VAALLLAGASPHIADPQGAVALHYAALLGSESLVRQLLAAGADPRVLDEDGASPSDAARSEKYDALAMLLSEATASFAG